jgi:hypothetical protein
LLLGLLLLGPPAALAEDDEPALLMNCAEFIEWNSAHMLTGGAARLGADILIGQDTEIRLSIPGPGSYGALRLEIDTGEFGFVVGAGGRLVIGEPVYISGSGAPAPLISVETGGSLTLFGTQDVLSGAFYSSLAASGERGVVLALAEGANINVNTSNCMYLAATGRDGIVIDSHIPLDYLRGFVIEAPGSGGKGIVSSAPLKLLLSRVTAQATAIEAPAVTLDTCAVFPAVANADAFTRTLVLEAHALLTVRGIPLGNPAGQNDVVRVSAMLEAPGRDTLYETVLLSFDGSRVDINTPGQYPMPATVLVPYDLAAHGLGGFMVEVFDPAIPYFYAAMPGWFWLSLIYTYTGEAEALNLWRSDDLGESWRLYWSGASGLDSTENLEVEHFDDALYLTFLNVLEELPGDTLFVFELTATGAASEILFVNIGDDSFESGFGGDRTGVDRFPWPWLKTSDDGPKVGDSGSKPSGRSSRDSRVALAQPVEGPPTEQPPQEPPAQLIEPPATPGGALPDSPGGAQNGGGAPLATPGGAAEPAAAAAALTVQQRVGANKIPAANLPVQAEEAPSGTPGGSVTENSGSALSGEPPAAQPVAPAGTPPPAEYAQPPLPAHSGGTALLAAAALVVAAAAALLWLRWRKPRRS